MLAGSGAQSAPALSERVPARPALAARPGGGSPAPSPGRREESRAPGSAPDPGPGRLGVDLDNLAADGPADGDDHEALPAALASGTGDQPLEKHLKYRPVARQKNSALADLSLHGKPLYAWVVEKRLRRRGGRDGQRLDQPRGATPWRLVKLVQRELTEAIQAAGQWNLSRWSAALHVMQERPRRRTPQTVPERIRHLITDCQARGVSNI